MFGKNNMPHFGEREVFSVSGSLNACRKVRVVETRKLGSENEEPAPPPEELESYL